MRILLNNIKECYDKILKKSEFGKTTICIIVALDVDGLCALRILTVNNSNISQSLLNRESLQFRIIPVSGYTDMVQAIESCGDIYKSIIFLNCGNLYDLSQYLNEGVKFYIFDNHQPIDHHNFHNQKQIFVIDDGMASFDKCPTDDMYEISDSDLNDDEDDEDEEEEHHSHEEDKRSEIQRKQERKFRKEFRKQKQLINQMHEDYYNDGTFYSRPTATIIYALAQQLNHECNDHLWYAILGLTDALIHMKTNQKNYEILFHELQNEVIRLNLQYELTQQNPEDVYIENSNKKIGVISIENEYKFFLLRSQSLYKAMYYSSYVGTKLKLWKEKDSKRLEEFIVRLGIPLNEAKQQYIYMNQRYKSLLKSKILEVANKFQMDDIMYRSFVRQVDSKIIISATDMVHAISTLLEYPTALLNKQLLQEQCSSVIERLNLQEDSSKFQNFWCALDSLDIKSLDLFTQAVTMSIEFQEALVDEANNLIEKKEIFPSKYFRYAILKNETAQQKKYFQHPTSLMKLALLLMDIHKESNHKQPNKSVVLVNQIQNSDLYMVVGVLGGMSFATQEKNKFGNYFLQVAHELQLQYRQDSFETSVIEIHKDGFPSFLDSILNFKK